MSQEAFGKRRFYTHRGRDEVHECAAAGDCTSLVSYLEAGADPDSGDGFDSALAAAIERGHHECVIALLGHGASTEELDPDGLEATHLMRAMSTHEGSKACAALLDAGANPLALDKQRWTPLHWACIAGRSESAKMICERGGYNEWRDASGYSALESAVSSGSVEIASMLARRWSSEGLASWLGGRADMDLSSMEAAGVARATSPAALAAVRAEWERRSLQAGVAPASSSAGLRI